MNTVVDAMQKSGLGNSVNTLNYVGKTLGTNADAFKEMTNTVVKPMTIKYNSKAMKTVASGKQTALAIVFKASGYRQ